MVFDWGLKALFVLFLCSLSETNAQYLQPELKQLLFFYTKIILVHPGQQIEITSGTVLCLSHKQRCLLGFISINIPFNLTCI